MNTLNTIIEAQKELNALNAIMNFDEDLFCNIEMMIDIHAESHDGSQSITDFVDMCISLAKC